MSRPDSPNEVPADVDVTFARVKPVTLVACVAASLSIAAPAAAQEPPLVEIGGPLPDHPAAPMTADLSAALAAAREHWGGDPPCGSVDVRHFDLGPWAGLAYRYRCRIDLATPLPDFAVLCPTVVHEVGHLHGHDHDEHGVPVDPAQVGGPMDYRTVYLPGAVPACERERERRERLSGRSARVTAAAAGKQRRCNRLARSAARRGSAARARRPARVRRCRARAKNLAARARTLRTAITWRRTPVVAAAAGVRPH
jgi:hypothetical protein